MRILVPWKINLRYYFSMNLLAHNIKIGAVKELPACTLKTSKSSFNSNTTASFLLFIFPPHVLSLLFSHSYNNILHDIKAENKGENSFHDMFILLAFFVSISFYTYFTYDMCFCVCVWERTSSRIWYLHFPILVDNFFSLMLNFHLIHPLIHMFAKNNIFPLSGLENERDISIERQWFIVVKVHGLIISYINLFSIILDPWHILFEALTNITHLTF